MELYLKTRTDRKLFTQFMKLLPLHLRGNEELLTVMAEFIVHRRELKRPLTSGAVRRVVKKLSPFSIPAVIEALNRSISNGWTDIYPKEVLANGSVLTAPVTLTKSDLIEIVSNTYKTEPKTCVYGYMNDSDLYLDRLYNEVLEPLVLLRDTWALDDAVKAVSIFYFALCRDRADAVADNIEDVYMYAAPVQELVIQYGEWLKEKEAYNIRPSLNNWFHPNGNTFMKFLAGLARTNENRNSLTGEVMKYA